jgi:hypothetical protein
MALRALLPEHHLSQDSKDAVKLAMGLIGTLSALVLGLLVASAKSSFDAQRNGLAQLSANLILLDRILAHYGPEAKESREQLRENVAAMIHQIWPEDRAQAGRVEPTAGSEGLYELIQGLSPKTETQRALQAAALKTGVDAAQARWSLFAQKGSAIPVPFLVIVVFWLAVLFASFSMFARPNATVIVALLFGALSVAGAIFLILELDRPFDGLIQLSSDPLRRALAQLGR